MLVLADLLDEEDGFVWREGAVAVAADVEGMVAVSVGAGEIAFVHAVESEAAFVCWRSANFEGDAEHGGKIFDAERAWRIFDDKTEICPNNAGRHSGGGWEGWHIRDLDGVFSVFVLIIVGGRGRWRRGIIARRGWRGGCRRTVTVGGVEVVPSPVVVSPPVDGSVVPFGVVLS